MKQPIIGTILHVANGPYFGPLMAGMTAAAGERQARLIAFQTHDVYTDRTGQLSNCSDKESHYPYGLVPSTGYVDGWVIFHDGPTDAELELLQATGKPIVTLARRIPGAPAVMSDNFAGTAEATRHLIQHGHQNIAFAGTLYFEDPRRRYEGYQHALRAAGLEPNPDWFFELRVDRGDDADQEMLLVAAMLERWEKLPFTALVTDDDVRAIKLMKALSERGYRFPQDLALFGFDKIEVGQQLNPPLASVEQPLTRIAEQAVEVILDLIAGKHVPPEPIYVPTILVARGTCGCRLSRNVPTAITPTASWRADLARELVEFVLAPQPLAPHADPLKIWPGAATIVQELAAAIDEHEPAPSIQAAVEAWTGVMRLIRDLEALPALILLLERTGLALLEQRGIQDQSQLKIFLQRCNLDVISARDRFAIQHRQALEDWNWTDHTVNLTLLSARESQARSLAWLNKTTMYWGCLGLWQIAEDEVQLSVEGTFVRSQERAHEARILNVADFPPRELVELEQRPNCLVMVVPVRSERYWGLLAVYGQMETRIMFYPYESTGQWAEELAAALDREELMHSLQSSQRAAEEARSVAEEASRLKTQFISNMSHELRTPLNAIINFSHFLNRETYGALSDRQQGLQKRIIFNAEHLLGLINDILDLSKIEAGHMELHYEETPLQPILKGVMATAQGLTKDKPVTLRLEALDDELVLYIDRTRIRQVLLNLLSNAAKFTKQGTITLRVQMVQAVVEGGQPGVMIAVEDSGIGIAPEHQALVFEEFRQVQGDLTREYHGTGLGLPISKKLVEMHGGRMWLESISGQGSTFAFTLPFTQAYDERSS